MPSALRGCVPFAIFVAFLIPSSARAACSGRQFGQGSPTFGYSYVHFPAMAEATPDSVIGRFWNLGARSATSEGNCDESFWLPSCDPSSYPCGGGESGHVFYINGWFGGMECQCGCGENDMIVLLQDRSDDSREAFFAVGRVGATPALPLLFDFSSIGRDWTLTAIPRPRIVGTSRPSPNTVTLTLAFDDPAPGFYGLPGAPASGTITAFHLYAVPLFGGQPPPGRDRGDWIFAARYPYTGGQTTGTYSFDTRYYSQLDLATALELDHGQFVTDYVSKTSPVLWDPDGFPGAGRVPERSLRVSKEGTGELTLTWGTACTGSDFEVFEGTLGQYYSHGRRTCSTGGAATLTFVPAEGDAYYLVVPTVLGGPVPEIVFEGSYGRLRDGTERPVGSPGCFVSQRLIWCP